MKILSKYEFPETLLFSRDNMWVRIAEMENTRSKVYVGLTDFAQQSIGPIELVRILPKGHCVGRGRPFGWIESEKRILLLRAPVLGLIQEVNERLREQPGLVSIDPYGRGWVAAFRPFQLEEDKNELVSKPGELKRLLARGAL